MIEGIKFHVKGSELMGLLSDRSKFHKTKAKDLVKDLKQAETGMKMAASAASKAGKAKSPARSYSAAVSASYGGGRNSGESIEDPVGALKEAMVYHTNRSIALEFYSKHLLPGETYVLTANDISSYELFVTQE